MSLLEIAKAFSSLAGAFAAAWFGAYLAFRKTRKERKLDRSVSWHVDTIQALAQYEERLKRLHSYSRNVLVAQRARDAVSTEIAPNIPQRIQVPERLWQNLREAEDAARSMLRLADAFTDLRTAVQCSTALSGPVNVVADQWFDLSPDPEVAWAGWATTAIQVASLREAVQRSYRSTLEVDGFLASVSPVYARFLLLRRIKKEQKRLTRRSAS